MIERAGGPGVAYTWDVNTGQAVAAAVVIDPASGLEVTEDLHTDVSGDGGDLTSLLP